MLLQQKKQKLTRKLHMMAMLTPNKKFIIKIPNSKWLLLTMLRNKDQGYNIKWEELHSKKQALEQEHKARLNNNKDILYLTSMLSKLDLTKATGQVAN